MQRLLPALMVAVAASCVAGDSSYAVKEHVALVQRQASLQSKVSEDLRASTAATAVNHWYLSEVGQNCDDRCQASGYVCDADGFPHDQTSSEQVAAVMGVECQTWNANGGTDAPFSIADGSQAAGCYYPYNSAATCSYVYGGRRLRFCPCKLATGSPTASPTGLPTASPTTSPTTLPTASPTTSATASSSNPCAKCYNAQQTGVCIPNPDCVSKPCMCTNPSGMQYCFKVKDGDSPVSSCEAQTPSASGDPHLINLRGERFDVNKVGMMEFLRVPYESVTEKANFTVFATIQDVSRSLDECKRALYITSARFGGAWLGDLDVEVSMHRDEMIVSLAGVQMKPSPQPVPIGSMLQLHFPREDQLHVRIGAASVDISRDIQRAHFFLNMRAASLQNLGYKIGGLLGEDSHDHVSKGSSRCQVSLLASPREASRSMASASLGSN